MKNLTTLITRIVLFCFGLWPLALILVYGGLQRVDQREAAT